MKTKTKTNLYRSRKCPTIHRARTL